MPEPTKFNTIAALAGRRVDAKDAASSQFPLSMVPVVRTRLSELLRKENVEYLVCSAACGADLLALDAALEAGINCHVILPFDKTRFRKTSVVDRPGDWGDLFDWIIPLIEERGSLRVLPEVTNTMRAFRFVNEAIVEQAATTAALRRLAIVVWEDHPRRHDDLTEEFLRIARTAGLDERVVLTTCD